MTNGEIFEKVEKGACVTLFSPLGSILYIKKKGQGKIYIEYTDSEDEFCIYEFQTISDMKNWIDDNLDNIEDWDNYYE